MKKFLAYLLAAIMVLSMVGTASASELAGTYDITVWVAAEIVDLTRLRSKLTTSPTNWASPSTPPSRLFPKPMPAPT